MANPLFGGKLVLAATGLAILSACSRMPVQSAAANGVRIEPDTMLLVSLEDGSIIRQTISLDADICVKALASPTTTCLTRGDAIVNHRGDVVGYEMLSQEIMLQGVN